MTQDIMRRILRDYFGYELHFVTNVTDVDDKVRRGCTALDSSSRALNSFESTIDHTKSSTVPSL